MEEAPLNRLPKPDSSAEEPFVIRHATYRDLSAISKVLKEAFWDEDAVGRFKHPKKEQYPVDVERYWERRLRGAFVDWQHDLIIAVDRRTGEILGVADWARNGPGAKTIKGRGWRWTFRSGQMLPKLINLANLVSKKLHPNRAAADPSSMTAYGRALPFFTHFWNPPRDEHWDLSVLGVSPAHQGKGVGRVLVAWGMQRAIDENIAASVVSSDGKERFYKQCGFEEIVGNVTEGEGNPLAGIRGGSILFRDKRSEETKELR